VHGNDDEYFGFLFLGTSIILMIRKKERKKVSDYPCPLLLILAPVVESKNFDWGTLALGNILVIVHYFYLSVSTWNFLILCVNILWRNARASNIFADARKGQSVALKEKRK
jgi:hypothetical protein